MRRAEAHHTAARRSTAALLMVDFLQTYEGEEGCVLHEQATAILPAVRKLRSAARGAGVPVIYANDHLGLWRGDQRELIARCLRGRGKQLVEQLRPGRSDLFVSKPSRSSFFQTPLEALLNGLRVRRLIIAGLATDVCVLATASDAVMRKLRCHVPADATATLDGERHLVALELMKRTMDADIRPSQHVRW